MRRQKLRWFGLVVFGFVISLILRIFVFEIHHVRGDSMNPTLMDGDIIFVSKLGYGPRLPRDVFEVPFFNILAYLVVSEQVIQNTIDSRNEFLRLRGSSEIARGDVVVFNQPPYQDNFFIKRCIGLPGDTIVLNNTSVMINAAIVGDTAIQSRAYVIPGKELGVSAVSPVLKQIQNYKTWLHGDGVVKNDAYVNNRKDLTHDYFFLIGDNLKNSTDSRTMGLIQEDHIVGKASFILLSNGSFKESFLAVRWSRVFKRII